MYPEEHHISDNLQSLLDHAQDKIVVVDEGGVYRFANDATERILGYEPEAFVGRNAFEDVHPDDRERVRSAFESLVEDPGEDLEELEYRYETADGSWVWLESRILNDPVAGLDGYVVSSRDVSARKRAEHGQRETETLLEELSANTDDVLWVFSGDWDELLFVNDAYEDIWGLSTEEIRERPKAFLDGIHPDDRREVLDAMDELRNGESVDLEYRVNRKREFRRWVWVKGHSVVEDGEVELIVGFARDITNRRRRERQLQVMDTLLRHNLRNDMNVILGHAELCARDDEHASLTEHMDVILETGRDLLETAEKEREIVDLLVDIGAPEVLDLRAVVSEVAAAVRESHPGATVELDATTEESRPGAGADGIGSAGAGDGTEGGGDADGAFRVRALPEVGRALAELVENAVEHAESPPEVSVALSRTGGGVEIVIEDNAPPIPDNEYEPLFGEGEPNEVYHGTGLGLWLVFWIVDLSEGDIDFEHGPSGNVITIWLPGEDD